MELQYRVRTYATVGELEAALAQQARSNWKLEQLCSHGPTGVLVVYTSPDPLPDEASQEIAPWDQAAQIAHEANLTHEFPDPRAED
jgi:hypothetical protein